jgi:hypothetical protein
VRGSIRLAAQCHCVPVNSNVRPHVSFLSTLFGARRPKSHQVSFDEEAVTFIQAGGERQVVRWSELVEVGILTTDEGPTVDDVHWILIDEKGEGFAVPSETEGMSQLVARLQKLPEFDNEAVVQAMGSSQDAKFHCWRRENAA